MSHFPVHTMDTAPGLPRPSLQSLGTAFGFIPNIAGTMATSSVLIGSLVELFGSVHGGNFSELQIQVLLLTNAVTNAAEWAVAFHSTLALKEGLSSSDVDAIRSRGLPSEPKLAALSRLARTLIETRGKLSPSDHDAFLRAGFLPENLLEVALAIRDEVLDLERAGAAIVQIDEAALREGLPLRRTDWQVYLNWAVECFRLTSSGVRDDTQLHTHMCYSEFNDISGAVGAMDADVISIETSRSKMELLSAFVERDYPNEIGPGVWDIHSPRVPSTEEMVQLLGRAREGLSAEQLWVNPDCGLRTRGWAEVSPAIANMVASARAMRSAI